MEDNRLSYQFLLFVCLKIQNYLGRGISLFTDRFVMVCLFDRDEYPGVSFARNDPRKKLLGFSRSSLTTTAVFDWGHDKGDS